MEGSFFTTSPEDILKEIQARSKTIQPSTTINTRSFFNTSVDDIIGEFKDYTPKGLSPVGKETPYDTQGQLSPDWAAMQLRTKKIEGAPEIPTIGAPTGRERVLSLGEQAQETSAYLEKKLQHHDEYNRIAKVIDVPGQFLANYVNSYLWRLPEATIGGMPAPKSELAETAGGFGSLFGAMGAGAGSVRGAAPFKALEKGMEKIFTRQPKTLAGTIANQLAKSATLLASVGAASVWKGDNLGEVMMNKLKVMPDGALMGLVYGGANFMKFSKVAPVLSHIFRAGIVATVEDLKNGTNPFDERSIFEKIFSYGSNAYFTRYAQNPAQLKKLLAITAKETRIFNQQAKKDGLAARLPETERLIDVAFRGPTPQPLTQPLVKAKNLGAKTLEWKEPLPEGIVPTEAPPKAGAPPVNVPTPPPQPPVVKAVPAPTPAPEIVVAPDQVARAVFDLKTRRATSGEESLTPSELDFLLKNDKTLSDKQYVALSNLKTQKEIAERNAKPVPAAPPIAQKTAPEARTATNAPVAKAKGGPRIIEVPEAERPPKIEGFPNEQSVVDYAQKEWVKANPTPKPGEFRDWVERRGAYTNDLLAKWRKGISPIEETPSTEEIIEKNKVEIAREVGSLREPKAPAPAPVRKVEERRKPENARFREAMDAVDEEAYLDSMVKSDALRRKLTGKELLEIHDKRMRAIGIDPNLDRSQWQAAWEKGHAPAPAPKKESDISKIIGRGMRYGWGKLTQEELKTVLEKDPKLSPSQRRVIEAEIARKQAPAPPPKVEEARPPVGEIPPPEGAEELRRIRERARKPFKPTGPSELPAYDRTIKNPVDLADAKAKAERELEGALARGEYFRDGDIAEFPGHEKQNNDNRIEAGIDREAERKKVRVPPPEPRPKFIPRPEEVIPPGMRGDYEEIIKPTLAMKYGAEQTEKFPEIIVRAIGKTHLILNRKYGLKLDTDDTMVEDIKGRLVEDILTPGELRTGKPTLESAVGSFVEAKTKYFYGDLVRQRVEREQQLPTREVRDEAGEDLEVADQESLGKTEEEAEVETARGFLLGKTPSAETEPEPENVERKLGRLLLRVKEGLSEEGQQLLDAMSEHGLDIESELSGIPKTTVQRRYQRLLQELIDEAENIPEARELLAQFDKISAERESRITEREKATETEKRIVGPEEAVRMISDRIKGTSEFVTVSENGKTITLPPMDAGDAALAANKGAEVGWEIERQVRLPEGKIQYILRQESGEPEVYKEYYTSGEKHGAVEVLSEEEIREANRMVDEFGKGDGRPTKLKPGSRIAEAVDAILHPKLGIVAPGTMEFELGLPESALKAWQKLKEHGGKKTWQNIREGVRLPYWSEKFRPLAEKLLDIEGIGSMATEKSYNLAEPLFKLKNKDNVYRVYEIEDEVGEVAAKSPAVRAKIRAEGIKLTPQELVAYKGGRAALRYVVQNYMRAMLKKQGASTQEVNDYIAEHYREGYLPHYRYGDLAILYENPKQTGTGRRYTRVLRFFDTEIERDAFERTLPKRIKQVNGGYRQVVVDRFRVSDRVRDVGAFVRFLESEPIVAVMMKNRWSPAEQAQAEKLRQMAGVSISKVAIKGRFAHRRGREGWSRDYDRALQDYFTNVPLGIAKRTMRDSVESIIGTQKIAGDREYARRMYDFWSGGTHREGVATRRARRIIYNYYLAAKPSFFLQNITQRVMATLPYAVAESGSLKKQGVNAPGGTAAVIAAQGKEFKFYRDMIDSFIHGRSSRPEDIIKNATYFSPREKDALLELMQRGELGSMRVEEATGRSILRARAPKFNKPGTWGKSILDVLEAFGTISEKSNRLHATLTSFELDKNRGLSTEKLMRNAMEATRRTQFAFSKATRQQMARGGLQSSLFVFKSFMMNYMGGFLPYLYKKDKGALMLSLGIFAGLAGAAGMPGYNFLRKNALGLDIPHFMVKLGLARNDEEANMKLQEYEDAMNEKTAGMLMRGAGAAVGIDGASWFGFSDPFKITPVSLAETAYNVASGPWGERSAGEWVARVSPTSAKHIVRSFLMDKTGQFTTNRWGEPLMTDEDISRMPGEIRGWMLKQYGKLPSVKSLSLIDKVLYSALMIPTTKISDYYGRLGTMRAVTKGVVEEKSVDNQAIADIFNQYLSDPKDAAFLAKAGPSEFSQKFWEIIRNMPPEAEKKMDEVYARIEKGGYRVNMTSVLGHIRKGLHIYKWQQEQAQ